MKTNQNYKGRYDPSKVGKDNTNVVDGLISNGLNAQKKFEFDFYLVLQNTGFCKDARRRYREKFYVPEEAMFLIRNDPEEPSLILTVKMKPEAEKITRIELNLLKAAGEVEVVNLFWEFQEK